MTARPAPARAVTALSDPAAQLRVDAACRTLGLPTIRAEAGRIAEAAARERLSHGAFLAEVLTAECDDRDARRRIRLVSEAKFPRVKRLTDFDITALPNLPPATLAELADGQHTGAKWTCHSQTFRAGSRLTRRQRPPQRLPRVVAVPPIQLARLIQDPGPRTPASPLIAALRLLRDQPPRRQIRTHPPRLTSYPDPGIFG